MLIRRPSTHDHPPRHPWTNCQVRLGVRQDKFHCSVKTVFRVVRQITVQETTVEWSERK